MSRKIGVACSPLTNKIYAGILSKKGDRFLADKQDLTIESLYSVSNHVVNFGKPVIISKQDGTPEFKITVEKLS